MGFLSMADSGKARPFAKAVLAFVEIALCITIICIVRYDLTAYWWSLDGETVYYGCLLGTDDQGRNMCDYTYALAGVQMAVALLLTMSSCIPCDCKCFKHTALVWDGVLVIFAIVWWICGASIGSAYNSNAGMKQEIQTSWRNAIIGLMWAVFVLVCIDYGMWQFRACYEVLGWCGAKADRDVQAAQNEQEMAADEYKETPNPVMAPKLDIENPVMTTSVFVEAGKV